MLKKMLVVAALSVIGTTIAFYITHPAFPV